MRMNTQISLSRSDNVLLVQVCTFHLQAVLQALCVFQDDYLELSGSQTAERFFWGVALLFSSVRMNPRWRLTYLIKISLQFKSVNYSKWRVVRVTHSSSQTSWVFFLSSLTQYFLPKNPRH